jgi:hypothetical protein
MRSLIRVSLGLLVGALAPSLRAQTLGFSIVPVSGSPAHGTAVDGGRQDFGSSLGLLFSLNASLTITGLGYWDDYASGAVGGDGVTAPLTVAIFDRNASGGPAIVPGGFFTFTGTAGTLVGAAVPDQWNSDENPGPATHSGRPGQFRMTDLSVPIVLPAGNYALVAWGYNNANQFLNGSNDGPVLSAFGFGGILTHDGNAYSNSTPGTYPNVTDLGNGVSGPLYTSATFTAIPEPAAVALSLAAAALAAVFLVRRRKSSPAI